MFRVLSIVKTQQRCFSTQTNSSPTAVVMMNMGGPATTDQVGPFLHRLFTDGEIVQLGRWQNIIGPLLAKRRTPKIEKQYQNIGGSPIRKWTEIQGAEMIKRLDALSPSTAPHKFYIAFRYAPPLTEETILAMKQDGVKRAIAFSQYPQYSCTTTGSSLNHMWRELKRLNLDKEFQWSVIDRWYRHPTFIQAVSNRIDLAMKKFDFTQNVGSSAQQIVIVFSAHSLPLKVVNRGDAYPAEVAATVDLVMSEVRRRHPHLSLTHTLAWQSQVGALPWLGPKTGEVLQGLGRQGHRHALVVPIAFTSDHIETLFEIDLEFAQEAHEAGITQFHRAPSLNDEPAIFDAFAEIVAQHIKQEEVCTPQYRLNCAHCVNPDCRSMLNPIKPYENLRTKAQAINAANGEKSAH